MTIRTNGSAVGGMGDQALKKIACGWWRSCVAPPLPTAPMGRVRTAPFGLAFFLGQYPSGSTLLAAGAVLVAAATRRRRGDVVCERGARA